jgi:aspartate/methionine/tyrosine aminotransferase
MSAPALNPYIAQRFVPFGNSIFAEMTRLATTHNAVNLAQGFPDFDGPEIAKAAAIAAIEAGHSQYARMIGVPTLNAAIAHRWEREGKGVINPDTQVTVTTGCSEAIINTLVGLLNPGDEVITFEPYFDFYTAGAAMAGATCRVVTLHPPREGAREFWYDPQELADAVTPRTRAILINTPHNPTGKVFSRAELDHIAHLCIKHNLIAISDEVYDQLVFDGDLPHISIATLPGMQDRTITLNSLGKTFSLTGWKVGWAIASPQLSAAVRACHQFITFSGSTPMQYGAAAVIASPGDFAARMCSLYRANRDALSSALTRAGLRVHPSNSTYFVMADHTALGYADDRDFVMNLIEKVGVAAIPPSVFYHNKQHGRSLVRFAFCKRPETIASAIQRLEALRPR